MATENRDVSENENPFERVRDQIGRCGLWCGSCGVGNGALASAARRLLEIYDGYGVHEWGPQDFDVQEFRKGLRSLGAMEGCRGCLEGDGNPECKLRPCVESRSIDDCTECGEREACPHREVLEKLHPGARAVGMLVKADKGENQALIEGWMETLKRSWPACVLFIESPSKDEQDN